MNATAPNIDRYLHYFEHRRYPEPWPATDRVRNAMEPLFAALAPLAPLKQNNEAKAIWLKIPRGDIFDYDTFEELKDAGEVKTYEEYVEYWKEDYPHEYKWYELIIVEGPKKGNARHFRAVSLGHKTIINHEVYEDLHEALSREWHIKRLGKVEKEALISKPSLHPTALILQNLWKKPLHS